MTCEEFETGFNAWLDTRKAQPLAPGLAAHRVSCPVCAEYAEEIGEIDWALSHLPEVEIPPDLIPPELLAAPRKPFSLWPRLGLTAALLILPAIVAWVVLPDIGVIWRIITNMILLTTGCGLLATGFLRPRMGVPELKILPGLPVR